MEQQNTGMKVLDSLERAKLGFRVFNMPFNEAEEVIDAYVSQGNYDPASVELFKDQLDTQRHIQEKGAELLSYQRADPSPGSQFVHKELAERARGKSYSFRIKDGQGRERGKPVLTFFIKVTAVLECRNLFFFPVWRTVWLNVLTFFAFALLYST